VLCNPANRNRTVELRRKQFHRNFTNMMAQTQAKAAVVNIHPRAANKVDTHKCDKPPLLVIGTGRDHTVPASISKDAAKRLGKSEAVVGYEEFAGRPHFAGASGWGAVADYALDWADRHTGATALT
jgi:dienelactone hydrolase